MLHALAGPPRWSGSLTHERPAGEPRRAAMLQRHTLAGEAMMANQRADVKGLRFGARRRGSVGVCLEGVTRRDLTDLSYSNRWSTAEEARPAGASELVGPEQGSARAAGADLDHGCINPTSTKCIASPGTSTHRMARVLRDTVAV